MSDRKIVIDEKQAESILDFYGVFGIPIAGDLKDAVKAFRAEQNFENQQKVKICLCKDICENPHPSFKDPIWDLVKTEARKIIEEEDLCRSTN